MNDNKSLVAIFANEDADIFGFRKELLKEILSTGKELLISCPYGEKLILLEKEMGYMYDNPPIDRRGTNLIADFKLFIHYLKVIKTYRPAVALMYTIKPNIYAGMACAILGVDYIGSITGLGTAIQNGGLLSKISLLLYRIGLFKAKCVFFQNTANLEIMRKQKVVAENQCKLVPGSGVNTEYFGYEDYPADDGVTRFVTVGRIMKDKGVEEILQAIRIVKRIYPNTVFRFIGDFDGNYQKQIYDAQRKSEIEYLGKKIDVRPYYKECNAIIHASYHEGMSNVLLEAASTGRPIIATRVAGCREIFDEGITGIGCEPKNVESLAKAIIRFIEMTHKEKAEMGRLGREKIKNQYDRRKVVAAYMNEINGCILE